MMDNKGYIQLYTGNGKGKTTAAFGLAVRALCAGKRVSIAQFVKSMKYHETRIGELFPTLEIRQWGRGCFISRNPDPEDVAAAHEGWRHCLSQLRSGQWDMVILDELNIALHFGLLEVDDIISGLRSRNPHTEVVITGRYAPEELIAEADLVTDMQEVKHYYTRGVAARDGIER